MEKNDQSNSEPELVQIAIDGNLYYAFKWWDELESGGRAVRYVVKDPAYGVVSYMLIFCAPRIPCGTGLVAVNFYPVEGADQNTDLWPAETTWENDDADIESAIRICSPKTAFQAYRGLPGDLEQMIREHKAGKRQLRLFGNIDTRSEDASKMNSDKFADLAKKLDENPMRVAAMVRGSVRKKLGNLGTVSEDDFTASPHFTNLVWRGTQYVLKKNAAAITEALFIAQKCYGLPGLHQEEIFSEVYGSNKKNWPSKNIRIQNLFRTGDAKRLWDDGCIGHDGKGNFHLNIKIHTYTQ